MPQGRPARAQDLLKATLNSWKIDPGPLPWPSCMLFGQTLILNDSTTNLHGFSASQLSLGDRKSIKNASGQHFENVYGKVIIQSTLLSQNDTPSPPKWHPRSMKNRPWTSQGSPWRSKGHSEVIRSSSRSLQDLKNDPPGPQKWHHNVIQSTVNTWKQNAQK